MASVMATGSPAKLTDWNTVFPPKQKTPQQSLQFMKKLIAVSISSITYLRALFPESAYTDQVAEGLQLKILLDNSNCPEANTVITWIRGCFDALEKKYLQKMTLILYLDEDNPDLAMETYSFRFSYTEAGEFEFSMMEADLKRNRQSYEVKRPTIKLLRTIIMLSQALEVLPSKYYITMKLHYYEDVTPPDYEPPGYILYCEEKYNFQERSVAVKVGNVSTAYHAITVRARTGASQFGLTDDNRLKPKDNQNGTKETCDSVDSSVIAGPPSISHIIGTEGPKTLDKDTLSSQEELVKRCVKFKRHRWQSRHLIFSSSQEHPGKELFEDHVPCLSPTLSQTRSDVITNIKETLVVPSSPDRQSTTTMLSTPELPDTNPSCSGSVHRRRSTRGFRKSEHNPEYPVHCPCGSNTEDDFMISCNSCGFRQHAACFAVMDKEKVPAKHICQECAPTPHICTDPKLCSSNLQSVKATCLYRRALISVSKVRGRLSEEIIARRLNIDSDMARQILDKFTVDKIVKAGRTQGSRVLDRDVLFSDAFPRYLNEQLDRGTSKTRKQYLKGTFETGDSQTPQSKRTKRSIVSAAEV